MTADQLTDPWRRGLRIAHRVCVDALEQGHTGADWIVRPGDRKIRKRR